MRADRHYRRALLENALLDHVVRRPIVYTDRYGLRYVLHPGENAGVYIAARGNYELAETRFCERVVAPGATVLDVGGNIGLYALQFAQLAGPTGRVHSFEPERRNAARIRENLALNGFENVTVVEAAVFSENGVIGLNVFAVAYNAWHSVGPVRMPDPSGADALVEAQEVQNVEAVTLDAYCERIDGSEIDLLKLDVEGAEIDALRGAAGLLATRSIKRILFEVSRPQIEALGHAPDAAFRLLTDNGYATHALTKDGRAGEPVHRAEDRYANYLAFAPGIDPPTG